MDGDDVAALEFAGLVKRFGDHVAVGHIDLVVPAGSFFGLVGPNGAGKTTSLSMAVGLLRPDGGSVRIFGQDVWADPVAAKALIGVLPDGMALPDRLSGREILLYLGLLRGMPREVVTERA
ncbi:MAG: ATP-binding cassette domain-containing protein, partial [Streptosporangiaceae bacterium]